MNEARSKRDNFAVIAIVGGLIWLALCAVGFKSLFDYSQTPGVQACVPATWPGDATLPVKPNQSTLVMFIHPHCPCSRASIGELAMLMARSSQHLSAYVLFWQPIGYPISWTKTDLWQSAGAIPGVQTVLDPDGKEARRFRSTTSGQVAVYDASGRLTFSGGITESRGHFGDSAALDSALASLANPSSKSCSAVFGCPLFGPTTGGEKQ